MTSRRQKCSGTRIATHRPAVPKTAHISWRLNSRHGELPWCSWEIELADRTITRPSMTNTAMTTAIR